MTDDRLHNDCDGGQCWACAADEERARQNACDDPADPRTGAIRSLARRAARAGLPLRDARALFDALYRADALMLEGGNVNAAARRAGVDRVMFARGRRRDDMGPRDPP